jgi:hypothetical protein
MFARWPVLPIHDRTIPAGEACGPRPNPMFSPTSHRCAPLRYPTRRTRCTRPSPVRPTCEKKLPLIMACECASAPRRSRRLLRRRCSPLRLRAVLRRHRRLCVARRSEAAEWRTADPAPGHRPRRAEEMGLPAATTDLACAEGKAKGWETLLTGPEHPEEASSFSERGPVATLRRLPGSEKLTREVGVKGLPGGRPFHWEARQALVPKSPPSEESTEIPLTGVPCPTASTRTCGSRFG